MEKESKIFKFETAHNKITLSRRRHLLELRSHDNAMQGLLDLATPQEIKLKNLEYLLAILLFIPPPKRLLMLGTAAGALIHFIRHHYPQSELTAVDIDVELIEHLLQMQVLPRAGEGLSYVYDDAKHFIEHCQQKYDLILVDIFTGAQSPSWLLLRDKIDRLHRLLSPNGALAYNLLIDSDHAFKQFYRMLRLVFAEQTLCMPVEGFENTIVFGMRSPVAVHDMSWYLQHARDKSNELGIDFVPVMSVIYDTNPTGQGVI